ncbi:PREDICTED: protein p13 MTCP-1-like, partial [Rhinopithecus bieti]
GCYYQITLLTGEFIQTQKSHLCPVRGCCRLRWRKAGLELEPKAQNGRRGCGAPPDHLWVHQEGIYRDEYQRTWVAVVEEETSFLRARVQQIQVPLGDAARPSHLLTSQLPLMWQLYPEERYMDNNSRLWQIQHHLMVRGVQELLLKLLPDD